MTTPSNNKKLVWLITGTSLGFGKELVRAALQRGDSVVATSRNPEKVKSAFPDAKDHLLAVAMDLSNPKEISEAVQSAISKFGRIDVLVNNAGFGLLSAVEEASEEEVARVHEVNVFGLLRVLRATLPQFRKQKSGHIVNLSSIGGLVGLPGFGIYNATKFAVEGLSEALAAELKPLGVHVTIVEPGPFRTDFLAGSLSVAKNVLPDYASTAGVTRANAETRNGKQPGDPAKAADAIVLAVTAEKPPLHLVLGKMAYDVATTKLDNLRKDMETWREVTLGADFKS